LNLTWGNAIEVPGSASLNTGGSAQVQSISCASAGNCSAGGIYADGAGHDQAFVVDETKAIWGSAIEVPGSASLNAGGSAQVQSISCASAGNCSTGGDYLDASNHEQAFVDSETNGTWGSAIEVAGTASLNPNASASVYSVSCPSAGNCSAGGTYGDASGNEEAFVVTESNGTWGNAIEVPGFASLDVNGGGFVYSISCPSALNCSAGGSYLDGSVHDQVFVVNKTNGTWGNAVEVPGTASLNVGGSDSIQSISCASAGNCGAGGQYIDGSNNFQAFVVTETDGSWGNAMEVPGTAPLNVGGLAYVDTVSCTAPNSCSAGGSYAELSHESQAFIVTETSGSWGSAMEVPGTASLNVGDAGVVQSLACATTDNCVAGGYYQDASNHYQSFVVNESNGTWADALEAPGTASLNAGGDAFISSVSCNATGSCGAGGAYTDGSNHLQALVDDLTTTTPTTTTTTTLPRRSVPGAPRIHATSTSRGSISISVVGTIKTGGSPILKYECSLNGNTWFIVSKNSHGVFVLGHLISHKTFSLRLRAVNRVGAGASSNTVKVTVR
jgi:hypothetical protein